MAIGDFYTQVVIIAIGATVILYAMARKCADSIEKEEDSLSKEGYIIQSHIWTTEMNDAVKDFVSFIQKNISESESEDKYIELFSSPEKIGSLKNRLDRLNKSYNTYLEFTDLFPNLVQAYEESKKWLIRTIVICFALASWGAVGFLIESQVTFPVAYEGIFWFSFWLLIVLSATFVCIVIYYNRKHGSIKATIRKEKSRYRDIIEKV